MRITEARLKSIIRSEFKGVMQEGIVDSTLDMFGVSDDFGRKVRMKAIELANEPQFDEWTTSYMGSVYAPQIQKVRKMGPNSAAAESKMVDNAIKSFEEWQRRGVQQRTDDYRRKQDAEQEEYRRKRDKEEAEYRAKSKLEDEERKRELQRRINAELVATGEDVHGNVVYTTRGDYEDAARSGRTPTGNLNWRGR
jgi:hypothetical protein